MMRRTVTVLALVSLAASCVSANPRSIPSATFPDSFGVNIHFTQGKPGEVKALSAAYKVARMDFMWDRIEKVKGTYDFSNYDILVKDLEAAGVRPLFILDYANPLYGKGMGNAEQRKAYAAFAAAAVTHFKGHLIMWEFWNEPNLVMFWGAKADPEEYAAMVNEAAPAILQADPDATLLLGAFSAFPWDYIETVFKRGCLKWADAVTVHPYRGGYPETAGKDYQRLRRLIAQYSPRREVPIISGEWGYSSNRKTGVPELRQAQYLVRQRLYNVRCGMLTSIWYDWKEDGPDPDENEHHFGSTHMDFSPKPAYTAAVTLTKTLAGYKYVRMLVDGPEQYVMLLRNGRAESAIAFWTVGPDRNYRLPAMPKRLIGMLGTKLLPFRDVPIGPSPTYALFGKNALLDTLASWTFLKPTTVLVVGAPLTSVFTVRNTGKKDRRFDVVIRAVGGSVTPAHSIVNLKPGRQASLPIALDIWRRVSDTSVTVTVRADGAVDTSRIPLIVANPIALSVNAASRGEIIVTLDAPGVRADETLTVRRTGPTGKPVGIGVPVLLRPGMVSYSVKVPYRAVSGVPLRCGAQVTDRKGRVAASLAPMSFVPLLDFEGSPMGQLPAGLTIRAEGDTKPGGSVSLTTREAEGHGLVADIVAEYPDGWRYFVVAPEVTAIPDNAVAVGMWVNGDASGDIIRVRLVDAMGQTIQPTYGPVNWKGWRWITMRLDDQTVGTWGGPQDGIIHKPIKWDSVFLLDTGSSAAHTAHVQFDDVTLMTR